MAPGGKGCVRAPVREEGGKEKRMLLAEAQRPETPLSSYSGKCCLVPSGWNINQGSSRDPNSKARLCQIIQGPVYQAKEVRHQL